MLAGLVRNLFRFMDEVHRDQIWWNEPKREEKYLASIKEGNMIKVISKYQFLLRIDTDGKRVIAYRGRPIDVTAEEFKKMRNKFIPYEEVINANNKQEQAKPQSKSGASSEATGSRPEGYR